MEHRSVIERWKGMYQQQVGDDHKAETTSQLALEEQAFHLHLIRQRHHRNYLSREVGLENYLYGSRQGLRGSQEESCSNRDTRGMFNLVNKIFTLLSTHIQIWIQNSPRQRLCLSSV